MEDNTENIINNLCDKAEKVDCSRCPLTVLALGIASVSLYIVIFLLIVGGRGDLTSKLNDMPFLFEVITSSLVLFTAILAASWQAFPDLSEQKLVGWLPALALFGFTMSFALNFALHPGNLLEMSYGMQCAMHLCLIALLPTILLYAVLARGVFLHAGRASLHVGLAAGMTAYLAARLAESVDDMLHMLVWHILPLMALVLVLSLLHRWLIRRKKL